MSGPMVSTSKPKVERGAFARRQRQMRLLMSLVMQAAIVVAVVLAGAFSEGRSRLLYLWAVVVPVGFTVVYLLAYRRGEAARDGGAWSLEWEKRDARRNYAFLGVVGLVWVAGCFAILNLT